MAGTPNFSAVLESIQVGTPTNYVYDDIADLHEKPWTSAIFKKRVAGPAFVGRTNITGDAQADLKHHGGVDKAVLAYSADHYLKWRDELRMPEMPHGAFGENLTIAGLSEQIVYIGDILRIGQAIFEVSQPRQPCWKLARRWRMRELAAMVVRNGRSGWYLRVLEEGWIDAGMPVTLLERPNPEWPIARAHEILHYRKTDLDLTLDLAGVPRLAHSWVKELHERAAQLQTERSRAEPLHSASDAQP